MFENLKGSHVRNFLGSRKLKRRLGINHLKTQKAGAQWRNFKLLTAVQFAKSQEFSNVRALQIFERKVLLSILNSRKIFKRDLRSSDSVAKFETQKSWFSETVLFIETHNECDPNFTRP